MLEVTAAGAAAAAVAAHVSTLVEDSVASRIAAKDASLWGPDAEAEAAIRLGWTELHTTTRALLPELEALRAALDAEGVDRVVLAGMGGSSLAPEVITQTAGVPLVVLDSTHPDQVRSALEGDLARTVLVVSSKSGGTVETDSQRRAFEAAFTAAGLDATRHIVVVTDPGSPLEQTARDAGYRAVFLADPDVGGRFSALSAFGVVPSALAGADVGQLLDEAAAVADLLTEDAESNPALVLGAALAGTSPLRDKLVFVDEGSGIVGLGDWAEQLVAESTGKSGLGLLPVVTSSPAGAPPELDSPAADVLAVRLVALGDEAVDAEADLARTDDDVAAPGDEVTVAGSLGAQLLLWEYATAVAGRLLGINPFDQPDVESAKTAARGLLDATPEPEAPAFVDGSVEVRVTPGLLDGSAAGSESLEHALGALLEAIPADGYLAVMAYLDREAHADLAAVRDALAARTGRPVTFGWGPRFLHSTGQLHKGGAHVGAYLQLTDEPREDLDVPGRPFTFGRLLSAQAAGDAAVLADHGRPVLRLQLRGAAALARVTEVLGTRQGA
ncbi:glucose-6-phosphate isomerase [Cellulomonas fimi]|uniref:Glucose-6-phosphate isomerase n=1 Tax=Cellulomonas fimi TaxID=1708 RepID=A0A7Y0QHA7_CELFI|nr:glucose-6-phosphate isomerase [Cellulomonas fimi]